MSSGSGRRTGGFSTDLRGSVLLEFVFAVTVLLVLFMGAATASFLFSDYYSVQKVAREGAREACIAGNEAGGTARAYESAWLWGLDPERLEVEFYRLDSGGGVAMACVVRYTARPFHRVFPLLVNRGPLGDVRITARAAFKQ